ncbi:MAG TPA: 16S rRNA (cytosine(967)-C(5))-methyltransferase RsmB [Mobilitalea sp.]|nr:16S rRNA (cytosine(967)-C(5))-methyltransferase RsmB [Mobilitalea sp.]
MIDKVNAREIVLDMLLEVIEGEKYSHTVLNQNLRHYQELEKQERAFISRLFTGTVKIYLTLDHVINQFASIPVRKMKPLIRNILRLSVYQLMFMDQVPESAVCNEAVKLAKKRGFVKLSGFINANLRNIIRGSATITYPDKEIKPREYLEIMYSVPLWLVSKLLEQYSFDTVEAMLAASLKEKEITIRCNQSKLTPVQLKELLISEGVTVEDSEYLDYAFKIRDYDYLEKMKSFNQGYFAIQDISSMLVCQVAKISENDFVVDVCAAPGGKALHAAEKAKRVSARDLTEYKIHLVEENINRLGICNIETKVWDATELDQEIIGQADIVICDLPCSGLGVLGKKSDIKYKLTQNQQKELVELQRTILGVAQNYVKPGGILIYSTCTVNKDENLDNRDWFLKQYEFDPENLDAFLPDSLQNTETKAGYLQLIQGVHNTDGFFLARMRRR